jgi:hypothetical protein
MPGIVSNAIAYGERRVQEHPYHDLPIVTHVLVVESKTTCIEALGESGVTRSDLSKYTANSRARIFFRRPKWLNDNYAAAIVQAAQSKLGCPYDRGLIVSELMADTFLGRWANKVFHQWPHQIIAKLLGERSEFICSELAAYALVVGSVTGLPESILDQPLDTIDPQDLFSDETIFDPFIIDASYTQNAPGGAAPGCATTATATPDPAQAPVSGSDSATGSRE